MNFLLVHTYSFNKNSEDYDNDEKDTHKEDIGERESEGKKKDAYERKQDHTHKRKGDELINSEEEDVPLHHSRHVTSRMALFPSSTA